MILIFFVMYGLDLNMHHFDYQFLFVIPFKKKLLLLLLLKNKILTFHVQNKKKECSSIINKETIICFQNANI